MSANRVKCNHFSSACEKLGLAVVELSERTLQQISSISPAWIKVGNPVDIWAAVSVQGLEQAYQLGMEAALDDEKVDAVISILLLSKEFAPASLEFILHLFAVISLNLIARAGAHLNEQSPQFES